MASPHGRRPQPRRYYVIAKQRHGPIGTVKLRYNGPITKFSDYTHRREG